MADEQEGMAGEAVSGAGGAGSVWRWSDWVSPRQSNDARAAGHHALQVAVDTIAYSQNVPVRLLLVDALRRLPQLLSDLLVDDNVKAVLRDNVSKLDPGDYALLADPQLLTQASDWILSFASPDLHDRPARLPHGWLHGLLTIFSHLERHIWLTEMGNPLPAHSLCRMHDLWALYILLWTWRHADEVLQTHAERGQVLQVLGVAGLQVRNMGVFDLPANEPGSVHQVAVIIGPYFECNLPAGQGTDPHVAFREVFRTFTRNSNGKLKSPVSSDTSPLRDELDDALEARIALSEAEAELRSHSVWRALQLLRSVSLVDMRASGPDWDGLTRPVLVRDDWESLAVMCSWLARWEGAVSGTVFAGQRRVRLHSARHWCLTGRFEGAAAAASDPGGWTLRLEYGTPLRSGGPDDVVLQDALEQYNGRQDGHIRADSHRIDRPEIFINRTRERQSASWSAKVIAINNLLNRHGRGGSNLGTDDLDDPPDAKRADMAEHLLRGFGGRICRYLVSMTRADLADLWWYDYAQTPPRLVNAGGFARVLVHRAAREAIYVRIDQRSWKGGELLDLQWPASARGESHSRAYRVAATGMEAPGNGDVGVDEVWADYLDPRPKSGSAVPLLVSGRVVGVMTLAGLVPGQFSRRLLPPLRRAATLVATCMYGQSLIWQMRRLNWLFAQRGAAHIFSRGHDNKYNPLKDLSRCLANVFLCPVVHIWLRSQDNRTRYEVCGYNWPVLMENAKGDVDRSPCFYWQPLLPNSHRDPRRDAFASLVIDVAGSPTNGGMPGGGRALAGGWFIQGRYDAELDRSVEFAGNKDSNKRVIKLGREFLPDGPEATDEETYLRSRRLLFTEIGRGGFGLDDVMAFALLRPDPEEPTNDLDIVGVITLHDWSYRGAGDNEDYSNSPWEPGWSNAVAHVQTYVPYLLTQAEVLDNPLNDARRFLIHAGRAELISVLDTMRGMRSRVENSLAPDRGVRQIIDRLLQPTFTGDVHAELQRAQLIAEKAWEIVQGATSPVWEQSLSQLSNVMQSYRELSSELKIQIAASNEDAHLRREVKNLVDAHQATLSHRGVYCDVAIPEDVTLRLPLLWLRILLADLVHNAAKYATSSRGFLIVWNSGDKSLTFSNAGSFRSDIDTIENIIRKGTQGSGALSKGVGRAAPKVAGIARQGQGMGVWGIKLLCDVLNIDFIPSIRPDKNLRILPDGRRMGEALYTFRMVFPAAMLKKIEPAGDDYH